MRPGEIFGLKWAQLEAHFADIRQRVYRGDIDSPKSNRSVRHAALSDGLLTSIDEWRALSLDTNSDAWVFASEKLAAGKRQLVAAAFPPEAEADSDWLGRTSRSCGGLTVLS